MKLSEELFELVDDSVFMPNITPAPDIELTDVEASSIEPGPELGVSNLLMQSIKDIYSMIEGYNSLSIALSDLKKEEMSQTISNIISEEHRHIGMLQELLKKVSPNAENIEVVDIINESLKENMADVGFKGDIYKAGNKVGAYEFSFGSSSYNFDINNKTHHWYTKEDFLDYLKENGYNIKRV